MKWQASFIFLLFAKFCFSQNFPPAITAVGDQNFCGQNQMRIVTQVSITDPNIGDNSLNVIFIQISEGYTAGSDQLTLTGLHPNITPSWSANEGLLTLTGPATFNEFVSAIEDVVFITTQTNFTEDKYFSINLGNANYLPSTGHYYLYISNLGITWNGAKNAAASQNYFGLQGYLATITSPEEAQLTGEQSPGTGWIGANDAESEGVWKWVTGPEAGTNFWLGVDTGSSQNGQFSFWNRGEPNNCCGGENYAHITDPSLGLIGSWNDLSDTRNDDPTSPYYPKGYLVEFGGMPGETEINLSASTRIITPKMAFDIPVICDGANVSLNITSNTNTVLWFDTPSSITPINTGLTYDVFVNSTTTFWLLPLFDGCTGGARTPLTVSVIGLPTALDISIVQCDDNTQDGISLFNMNNFSNTIIGGSNSDRQITYFEDAALTNEIDGDVYTNTTNPQIIYALVTDTVYGCSNVAEITLNISTTTSNDANLEVCDDFVVDGYNFFDLSLANNQLFVGAPSNATSEYYETYNDALLGTNPLPNNYFNAIQNQQIIYAKVENNNDCFGISEVSLSVRELPNVIPYEEVYYCLNNFPQTITLYGGILDNSTNNYFYDWSTGETTTNIEINQIGTYTVFITDPTGCTNRRIIKVLPSNIATINTIEINDLSENNTVTVLVFGEGEYEYAIDNINGPYQSSSIFVDVLAGIHTIFIRDIKNNCGVVMENISVIGYPKFFTPNNDGVNDTWKIKGISSLFQPKTKVFIFDRYGKLLFTLNAPTDSWDGRFNGQILPSSDYWFKLILDDGRIFNGHFTLKN